MIQNVKPTRTKPGPNDPKLRIGWSWGSDDGWTLHRDIKDGLWGCLNEDGGFNITAIFKTLISVKNSWLDIHPGDKVPPNYLMFKFLWENYKKVYRKFNPPVLYRVGINRVGIIVLTLFKEDSAYTERIGGIVQYIVDHKEDWPKNKEARLLALEDLKLWWYEEDWRSRQKDTFLSIFDWIIEKYDTDEFIRKTIDFWIDGIIVNANNWIHDDFFKPERWYPRGKGQCNYLCHGRKV